MMNRYTLPTTGYLPVSFTLLKQKPFPIHLCHGYQPAETENLRTLLVCPRRPLTILGLG